MTNTELALSSAATKPQISYIKSLLDQLAAFDAVVVVHYRDQLNEAWLRQECTRKYASSVISNLLSAIRDYQEHAKTISPIKTAIPEIPIGRYAIEIEPERFTFYKVWVSKSNGYRGVSVQSSDDFISLNRTQSLDILKKIEKIGAKESSIAYGKQIGCCGVCGRTLTKKESIDAGIGPICAGKF